MAVSAPVGGGKSTLVRGLLQRLPDSAAIHFDHYETLTERPLEDIARWMRDGADVDGFVIERLPEDIVKLRSGEAVVDPATGQEISPARTLLFETPFARLHRATGGAIDLAIWIDTPLDVALARNIREFTMRPEMYQDLGPWLRGYLDSYLETVREVLCLQQTVVGNAADLVLDGRSDVDTNVRLAAEEIGRRLA